MIIIMIIINKWRNKCENWNIGNWKLSSEIGKLEFQITKFGNQNFEELFKNGILSKWISEWDNNNSNNNR